MEQKSIITEGNARIFTFSMSKEAIFDQVSLQSNYYTEQSTDYSDLHTIMDDDKAIFNQNLRIALADLTGLLARRIDTKVKVYDEDDKETFNDGLYDSRSRIEYNLVISDNHSEAVLSTLVDYAVDYVSKRVLERWYRTDFGSEQSKLKIINAIQFRKKPVRTKIGPVF